jgi:Mrp family chromosome partitioning ATPase
MLLPSLPFLIVCFFVFAGINILGVVENMTDMKISFSSLLQAASGVKLVNKQGEDVTTSVIQT